MKDRAKVQTVQEVVNKIEEQHGDLKKMLDDAVHRMKSTSDKDAAVLDEIQSDVKRALTNTASNLRKINEDMKNKASADEVSGMKTELEGTKKAMTVELPQLRNVVQHKADVDELERLKREILSIVEDLSSVAKDPSVLLGGRQYCLSCFQTVASFGDGPESEASTKITTVEGHHHHGTSRPVTVANHTSRIHAADTSNKSAYPPPINTTWNPAVSTPLSRSPSDSKVKLPGFSSPTSGISGARPNTTSPDTSKVYSSYGRMMPVVSVTDPKTGKTTTKAYNDFKDRASTAKPSAGR